MRSWFDFCGRDYFNKPKSLAEASTRTQKNVVYFATNYAAVTALFLVMTMYVWQPESANRVNSPSDLCKGQSF
jgi:hypothetical protein